MNKKRQGWIEAGRELDEELRRLEGELGDLDVLTMPEDEVQRRIDELESEVAYHEDEAARAEEELEEVRAAREGSERRIHAAEVLIAHGRDPGGRIAKVLKAWKGLA